MSRLTEYLIQLYKQTPEEVRATADFVLNLMSIAWRRGISDEAHAAGCPQAFGKPPSGRYLQELTALARKDAVGIADTFNRDITREINRLVAANPDEAPGFYGQQLEAWIRQRNAWKNRQIALNSELQGREIGRGHFWRNNYQAMQFRFAGPPTGCPICLRLLGLGTVSREYMEAHPAPIHINCPHYWKAVNTKPLRLDCATIWVG